MPAGYRIYRKGETTAADHDRNTMLLDIKRARRQAEEFRGYANDLKRSEENRAACLAKAAGCDRAAEYYEGLMQAREAA